MDRKKYKDHLLLSTNDFPFLRDDLQQQDLAKLKANRTIRTVKERFPYAPEQNKYLLIPMCVLKDGHPYHWILLTFKNGAWGIYNSADYLTEYEWQIHTMTVPLTKVLNEMGHKDLTGRPVNSSFKQHPSPKQTS
ncbi:hypothetical protein MKW94_012444, partial [Papaver nudicaule]|nr:hypothetical protein [Papaver nudicaule]